MKSLTSFILESTNIKVKDILAGEEEHFQELKDFLNEIK